MNIYIYIKESYCSYEINDSNCGIVFGSKYFGRLVKLSKAFLVSICRCICLYMEYLLNVTSFRDHLLFDECKNENRSKVKLAGIVACVQNNVLVLNNNTLNKRASPS